MSLQALQRPNLSLVNRPRFAGKQDTPTPVPGTPEGVNRAFQDAFVRTEGLSHGGSEMWNAVKDIHTEVRLMRTGYETQVATLQEKLVTDEMTGLKNRLFFNRELDAAFERSKTQGTPLSVIMVDLNRFKQINDNLGHDVGDIALMKLSEALKKAVGNQGYHPCRLGGDEFAILLPGATMSQATAVAEALKHEMKNASFQAKDLKGVERTVYLSASQGICTLNDPAGSASSPQDERLARLLRKVDDTVKTPRDMKVTADAVMYVAKKLSRTSVWARLSNSLAGYPPIKRDWVVGQQVSLARD